MTIAAVFTPSPRDDSLPPFPSSTGYGPGEEDAYRRAAYPLALVWAAALLAGATPVRAEQDARITAHIMAEQQVGRELTWAEIALADAAMREVWRTRRAPLALVPDSVPTTELDLVERAEAESADWSDMLREIL